MISKANAKKAKERYFIKRLEEIQKLGEELKEMKELFVEELYTEKVKRYGFSCGEKRESFIPKDIEELEFEVFMREMLQACHFA